MVEDGIVLIPLSGQTSDLGASGTKYPSGSSLLGYFVAGPENSLVPVVVRSLLDPSPTPYSPVVLFGPPGIGKTHLALGVAGIWKATFPRQSLAVTTGADFARQLAEAIETKSVEDLVDRYRHAALLVIEDLEQLLRKQAAQAELIDILDMLAAEEAKVLVTSRAAPNQIEGLAPALRSRLTAGLTVPLACPGKAARAAILRRLALQRAIELPEPVLELLAEGVVGTVPELLRVLMEIEMTARLEAVPIDTDLAARCLRARQQVAAPSLREIAELTARYFSVTLRQLRSATRCRAVVLARAVAMYLARTRTASSLEQIGRYFGGRDHTTVAYGCRKTLDRLATEPEVREAVECLQERLAQPSILLRKPC